MCPNRGLRKITRTETEVELKKEGNTFYVNIANYAYLHFYYVFFRKKNIKNIIKLQVVGYIHINSLLHGKMKKNKGNTLSSTKHN